MASAGPAIAVAQLAGIGNLAPVAVPTVRDAYTARASEFVHGYFDRRGGSLHFEFSTEDAATHRTSRVLPAEGGILSAADALSKSFHPSARGFSSSNEEAVAAWGQRDYARALEIDPDFSAASLGLAQQMIGSGRREEGLRILETARTRPARSPIEMGQISLLYFTLKGDIAARDQALLEQAKLLPNDASLAKNIAERFMESRQFALAAQALENAVRIDPDDAGALNTLGYARSYNGDLPGAIEAFDRYQQQPGQEANALDSRGEALFMHGQFVEAEKAFLQSHEKNPDFLQGSGLLKAAYARWLGGDLPGADSVFARYLMYRSEHGDRLVEWRRAGWEYSTARRNEAMLRLSAVTGEAAQIARQQLEVWRRPEALPQDLRALREAYLRTPPAQDGLVRTFYARALARDGKIDEARALVALYPLPESGDLALRSYLYPVFLEVKKTVQ